MARLTARASAAPPNAASAGSWSGGVSLGVQFCADSLLDEFSDHTSGLVRYFERWKVAHRF